VAKVEKQWVIIDASKAYGMAGEISPDENAIDYGVDYVSMFRGSIEFGDIKVFLDIYCIIFEFPFRKIVVLWHNFGILNFHHIFNSKLVVSRELKNCLVH